MGRHGFILVLLAASGACSEGWPDCATPRFDTEGHRGARAQRPENTLSAFEYALAHGVSTLEMDLAVTKDDVLVVSHDPVLRPERCLDPQGQPANHVPIRQISFVELQGFDCGALSHPDFPTQVPVVGSAPPAFRQVVAMAEARSGERIHYNVEVKSSPSWPSEWQVSPQLFVDLLEDELATMGIAERTLVQSFDSRPLRILHKRGSRIRRSVLFPSGDGGIQKDWAFGNVVENARWVGASVLSPSAAVTRKSLVEEAHAQGLAVIPWTVNDPAQMEKLMRMGVDGLISDDVDVMVAAVSRLRPSGGVCF